MADLALSRAHDATCNLLLALKLQKLLAMLTSTDAERVSRELDEFIGMRPCWTTPQTLEPAAPKVLPKNARSIAARLQHSTYEIIVPKRDTPFVVATEFEVTRTNPNALLQITEIGPGVKQLCWRVVEEPQQQQLIRFCDLLDDSSLSGVTIALGNASPNTTFTALHFLLTQQGRGQEGFLRHSGAHNTFCVIGCHEVIQPNGERGLVPVAVLLKVHWAIGARFPGWVLNAEKVDHNPLQRANLRIFYSEPQLVQGP